MKLKVLSILGTRPELIRLSRILPRIDKHFNHIFVYTQQSYDYEMSKIFFKELDIRKPDYLLNVRAGTLGGQLANIFSQTEKVIIREKPDIVFVLGDTNSILSVILAKRMKIPVFHMEAGTRSFDWEHPEEINRVIIDHISDYNLAYTEHNRRNLIKEGLPLQGMVVTGTPMGEVLNYYQDKINSSKILKKLGLEEQKYFLLSAHREENVTNKKRMSGLIETMNAIAEKYKFPVIVTTHPRTKKMISGKKINSKVFLEKPFGFFDYVKLQQNALCVLSDSGTLEEEAAILGFKAVYLRHVTHRPEVYDSGVMVLCGVFKDEVLSALDLTLKEDSIKFKPPLDYMDNEVSLKVVKVLLGFGGQLKRRSMPQP